MLILFRKIGTVRYIPLPHHVRKRVVRAINENENVKFSTVHYNYNYSVRSSTLTITSRGRLRSSAGRYRVRQLGVRVIHKRTK